MNENTKPPATALLEEATKLLEDAFALPATPLPTDEIIPHVGLTIEVAEGEWIPSTQVLWRSWTGRRKVWGMEYHGPVFNVDRDDSVPYAGKRVCLCSKCQEHVVASMKPS
jgi:hypothetical protein